MTSLRTSAAFLLLFLGAPPAQAVAPFVRGDANRDDGVDIADAIFTLDYLFGAGAELPCADAADANDDGAVDIADAIRELDHLFGDGVPFPPPFPEGGSDPTADSLGCGGTVPEFVTLSYDPRQCERDPWESADGADPAERLAAWAESLGATVNWVRLEPWPGPVCDACGCPRGYTLVISLSGEDVVDQLIALGFELLLPL